MILSCDLVRPTTTTRMMNKIRKYNARIIRYLESKLQLSTPSFLITLVMSAFISLVNSQNAFCMLMCVFTLLHATDFESASRFAPSETVSIMDIL